MRFVITTQEKKVPEGLLPGCRGVSAQGVRDVAQPANALVIHFLQDPTLLCSSANIHIKYTS